VRDNTIIKYVGADTDITLLDNVSVDDNAFYDRTDINSITTSYGTYYKEGNGNGKVWITITYGDNIAKTFYLANY
jgi:hypothetical protein